MSTTNINNTPEFWEDIKGYEGIYSVSNLGNIKKTFKNGGTKILKPYTAGKGYYVVSLYKDKVRLQQYVHRLVLQTFLANPMGKATGNHENGDKSFNALENLTWMSHSENMLHAEATGLHKGNKKMT